MIPSNPSRKISVSMLVFGACIIGIGLGLFGLNFWQATRCGVGTGFRISIPAIMFPFSRTLYLFIS